MQARTLAARKASVNSQARFLRVMAVAPVYTGRQHSNQWQDMAKKPIETDSIKDPFASREAENYENPIPSREYILEYLEQTGEPVSYEALCEHLSLESHDQTEALRRRLIAMTRDGQLISNRRGV